MTGKKRRTDSSVSSGETSRWVPARCFFGASGLPWSGSLTSVAETELAVRRWLDSTGLVAETELAVAHWPDAAVPGVLRQVS